MILLLDTTFDNKREEFSDIVSDTISVRLTFDLKCNIIVGLDFWYEISTLVLTDDEAMIPKVIDRAFVIVSICSTDLHKVYGDWFGFGIIPINCHDSKILCTFGCELRCTKYLDILFINFASTMLHAHRLFPKCILIDLDEFFILEYS